ncbi:hypothetical protein A1Q1_04231 [Trichosporon asahii var. asahii CBS 2479]|uniref:Histone acetyltransferase type B catalytic subunit n=1 Tax=Trichosporon asahii var. asahii (strain ATCC 90039 / CBS 2479 / JCM 2466 / KCTC 7840 / NBRC 103889/ NCYC 2677 / UAMH 7654) TaxID=1186058 RepID=J5QEY6_TRIAS|nr:hypothetical protein A1Q1_04231 [Trichosporon asahii var. asahii CBS 2479]EJT46988.1 hypothetical protein A1Q1_04231 [Trichosporon asahii var. asahii CBS 2479]
MADNDEAWVTNSNEALNLQLAEEDAEQLHGEDRVVIEPFHPDFTYPIFGDQEKIFGYKGLDIKLHFASGSLKQFLQITYDEKIEDEATPADDVEGELFKFLPADYTKSAVAFEQTVEEDAKSFKPMGELIGSYTLRAASSKGKGKANGEGPAADADHAVSYEMFKIFILLFIEGGSYIQEDEEAWEFEKRRRPDTDIETYHFVGYTSLYPFWCFPDQVRLRLSQFVILPPYQHLGHGSRLYSALFKHMLGREGVAELTVEDPAEAFEDLRDRNDLRFLVEQGVPEDPKFLEGVGDNSRAERAKWEAGLRKKYKIAQRQFDRLLEMLLLRQLDRKDAAKVRAYRLQVKARLYRFNYMTPEERKEALAKTYDTVIDDYDRILGMTFH